MKKLKTTAVLQSRAKNTTLPDSKSNYNLQDPLNQKNLKVKVKGQVSLCSLKCQSIICDCKLLTNCSIRLQDTGIIHLLLRCS